MGSLFLDANLVKGWVPDVFYGLSAVVALLVLVRRRYRRRRWVVLALILAAAAGLGWATSWFFSDVYRVFGIGLPHAAWRWVTTGFVLVALGIVAVVEKSRLWRKILGILLVVLALLSSAIGINAVYGQYTSLRSVLGVSVYSDLDLTGVLDAAQVTGDASLSTWTSPADMPDEGVVGSIEIPGTVSGFDARNATVYLPPAALTANPPALPVLIVLSGQPGSPDDPFTAGHLKKILDEYAAEHDGMAPIVVSPDQLSDPYTNPMCVDGPLGNSATYLTVDVPAWITAHLPVTTDATAWSIAGFSQGATCAVQLGAGHPEIFQHILAVAPEETPANGNVSHTIQVGFDGDEAAYEAAAPAAIIAAHATASQHIYLAAGEKDSEFRANVEALAEAAEEADMYVDTIISPGTAHDWYTVQYAYRQVLPEIAGDSGIPGDTEPMEG